MRGHRYFAGLLAVVAAATVWSGVRPKDYGTWAFELSVGAAGVAVLAATYRRFRFSGLVYVVAAIHYAVLAAGAKYTYAEMPLFEWLKGAMHLSRNHFDRVGHFMQGVTPAVAARELLLRTSGLRSGKWVAGLCVAIGLAVSAGYEILEWWMVVVFYPGAGPEWLGMQGDQWDAQGDMLMAGLGAAAAVLLLGRVHDRSMAEVGLCDAGVSG